MKFLVGLLLLLLIVPANAQETVERYAYAALTQSGDLSIQVIDPSDLTVAKELTTIPANGSANSVISLSPLGEWILLRTDHDDKRGFRLFHVADGLSLDVIDDVQLLARANFYNGDFEPLHWSLNDAYLAFHSWDSSTDMHGLYLYNTLSQTLTDLSAVGTSQYESVFSPDSTHLAFVSNDCEGQGCSVSLELYDPQTASPVKSIDIGLFGDIGVSGACHLEWSDDNAYIAFASSCDPSAMGRRNDVYVVEVATGEITDATAMTPTDVEPGLSLYRAEFDFAWRDASTLFISVHKNEGMMRFGETTPSPQPEPTMRTLLYNAQDHSTTIINGNHVGRWSRATPDLWAYVHYSYSEIPQAGEFYSEAVVKILSFDEFFTDVARGPAGCRLQWNRQKTMLAYQAASPVFCNSSVLYFLSAETGILSPLDTPGVPLGWMCLPHEKVEVLPSVPLETPPPPTLTSAGLG